MQDDLLFSHLTVKETLTYAALLRLPLTLTRNQKKERAMNVINELGLERYIYNIPSNIKHPSICQDELADTASHLAFYYLHSTASVWVLSQKTLV